ncbi:MAG: hypothetical protein II604_01235, partial [Bacteroidales bacterium]|nr:hypothetical protein [Bacteroidales bacterium]
YSAYNYSVVPVRDTEDRTFRGQDSNVVVTKAKDKPAPVITPPKKTPLPTSRRKQPILLEITFSSL